MASSELFIISIHALREEGDASCQAFLLRCSYFYPRPPRGGRHMLCRHRLVLDFYFYPRPPRGGRRFGPNTRVRCLLFLSTPSARRATDPDICVNCPLEDFYPRPPRGGRLCRVLTFALCTLFLSTPSARRATVIRRFSSARSNNFYPRPPRGGRPVTDDPHPTERKISIHALREEGDAGHTAFV